MLRDYQVKLNKPADKFLRTKKAGQRAQVYAPTGAGKTVCFNELIKSSITRGKKNIAILHPRIALSQDQLRRFQKEFGDTVHTTSFHSGGYTNNAGAVAGKSTTDEVELDTIIKQTASVLSKPHVTFSSYHSFDKLIKQNIKFDIVICDEAHYLVQDQFYEYLPNILADKILFYTATPITNEFEDDLMLDESLFGKIIAMVEPKELIKPGYIVAPLIHMLECKTTQQSDMVDVIDLVARAFAQQYREITKRGMPYAQMLVASRGVTTDLAEIQDNLGTLWAKIDEELGVGTLTEPVVVYTISSEGAFRNGKPMASRDEALREIKNSGKNVIVAHYDTLSEGIDIDTLTGALIMRKMSKAKLLQTIGRCARPYSGDLDDTATPRKDLYDYEAGIDLRKKPRCIITLPVIDGKWIANDDGMVVAEAFIAGGYGELLTYVEKKEDTATGIKREPLLDLEEDTFMSAITSHHVNRELEDLRRLFDIEE